MSYDTAQGLTDNHEIMLGMLGVSSYHWTERAAAAARSTNCSCSNLVYFRHHMTPANLRHNLDNHAHLWCLAPGLGGIGQSKKWESNRFRWKSDFFLIAPSSLDLSFANTMWPCLGLGPPGQNFKQFDLKEFSCLTHVKQEWGNP